MKTIIPLTSSSIEDDLVDDDDDLTTNNNNIEYLEDDLIVDYDDDDDDDSYLLKYKYEQNEYNKLHETLNECRKWIEKTSGKQFEYEDDFRRSLENGIILCELLNKLKEGTIKRINRFKTPLAGIDNLTLFLNACEQRFSIMKAQLFDATDLEDTNKRSVTLTIDEQNRRLKKVINTIHLLSRKAQDQGIYCEYYLPTHSTTQLFSTITPPISLTSRAPTPQSQQSVHVPSSSQQSISNLSHISTSTSTSSSISSSISYLNQRQQQQQRHSLRITSGNSDHVLIKMISSLNTVNTSESLSISTKDNTSDCSQTPFMSIHKRKDDSCSDTTLDSLSCYSAISSSTTSQLPQAYQQQQSQHQQQQQQHNQFYSNHSSSSGSCSLSSGFISPTQNQSSIAAPPPPPQPPLLATTVIPTRHIDRRISASTLQQDPYKYNVNYQEAGQRLARTATQQLKYTDKIKDAKMEIHQQYVDKLNSESSSAAAAAALANGGSVSVNGTDDWQDSVDDWKKRRKQKQSKAPSSTDEQQQPAPLQKTQSSKVESTVPQQQQPLKLSYSTNASYSTTTNSLLIPVSTSSSTIPSTSSSSASTVKHSNNNPSNMSWSNEEQTIATTSLLDKYRDKKKNEQTMEDNDDVSEMINNNDSKDELDTTSSLSPPRRYRQIQKLFKISRTYADNQRGFGFCILNNQLGAYIAAVEKNSLAANVGLLKDDRVLHINNYKTSSLTNEQLRNIMKERLALNSIELLVSRAIEITTNENDGDDDDDIKNKQNEEFDDDEDNIHTTTYSEVKALLPSLQTQLELPRTAQPQLPPSSLSTLSELAEQRESVSTYIMPKLSTTSATATTATTTPLATNNNNSNNKVQINSNRYSLDSNLLYTPKPFINGNKAVTTSTTLNSSLRINNSNSNQKTQEQSVNEENVIPELPSTAPPPLPTSAPPPPPSSTQLILDNFLNTHTEVVNDAKESFIKQELLNNIKSIENWKTEHELLLKKKYEEEQINIENTLKSNLEAIKQEEYKKREEEKVKLEKEKLRLHELEIKQREKQIKEKEQQVQQSLLLTMSQSYIQQHQPAAPSTFTTKFTITEQNNQMSNNMNNKNDDLYGNSGNMHDVLKRVQDSMDTLRLELLQKQDIPVNRHVDSNSGCLFSNAITTNTLNTSSTISSHQNQRDALILEKERIEQEKERLRREAEIIRQEKELLLLNKASSSSSLYHQTPQSQIIPTTTTASQYYKIPSYQPPPPPPVTQSIQKSISSPYYPTNPNQTSNNYMMMPQPLYDYKPQSSFYSQHTTYDRPPPSTPSAQIHYMNQSCSLCGYEIGHSLAMAIESLNLIYHLKCFRCSVCSLPLANGKNGVDVRIRGPNNRLHCNACFSNDNGNVNNSTNRYIDLMDHFY